MSKIKSFTSLICAIFISCALMVAGIFAATQASSTITMGFAYGEGVHSIIQLATSNDDATYPVSGTTLPAAKAKTKVFDNHTTGSMILTPITISNAAIDTDNTFNIYLGISNYTTFAVTANVEVTFGMYHKTESTNYNFTITNNGTSLAGTSGTNVIKIVFTAKTPTQVLESININVDLDA